MTTKLESGNVHVAKRKNPFAQIPNKTLQDKRLSFRARGLLVFMLSMPDQFIIRKSTLYQFCKGEGRDAVKTAFEELVDLGYIVDIPLIRPGGKFTVANYLVYEEPVVSENSPLTENPLTVEPLTANPSLLNTKGINTEELKKEKEKKEKVPLFEMEEDNTTRIPDTESDKKSDSYPKDKTYIDDQGYPSINGSRWIISQEEFNTSEEGMKEWLEREHPEQFLLLKEKKGAPQSLFKKPKPSKR